MNAFRWRRRQQLGQRGNAPPTLLLLTLTCLITWASVTAGDEGQSGDGESSAPSDSSATATLPLPTTYRDGRPFRPIGVYQSQLIDLVPKDFRPVSIDQLASALEQESQQVADPVQSRLVSGFYDVRLDGRMLVSERSELVLKHPAGLSLRKSLGPVNLAITSVSGNFPIGDGSDPAGSNRQRPPRLEADPQGDLIAVVAANPDSAEEPEAADAPSDPDASDETDSEGAPAGTDPFAKAASSENEPVSGAEAKLRTSNIRFAWTARGRSIGAAKKFELSIPRTSQTRFVISTPSDIELESGQGVLMERPGPPPDADVQSRTGDIRWYVLEAGGLNRVELYASRRLESEGSRPLLVRFESKQYEVTLAGMTWKHRVRIELPTRRDKLLFRVPAATLTNVRLNSVEANYQVRRDGEGNALVEVDLPSGFETTTPANGSGATNPDQQLSGTQLITLTLEGVSDWELADGVCDLSSATLFDSDVIYTESSTQATVSIMEPLALAQWKLPPRWRQSTGNPTREGETIYVAEGPPISQSDDAQLADAPSEIVGDRTDNQAGYQRGAWSRLRLLERPERSVDEIWTRVRVQQEPSPRMRAVTRVRYRLLSDRQSPMRLEVNPQWSIDSVTVIGSGRQIAVGAGPEMVIWPTSEEASESTFEIDIASHQNLPVNRRQLLVPTSWIVQTSEHAASQLIAIQPPKLRRWDGSSVMLTGRIERSELGPDAADFFSPTSETLLLRNASGRLPRVTLESADVSLSVSIRHEIETQGNDVGETIVVRAETTQPISELSIETGNTRGDAFAWSLRKNDLSATISLPASVIEHASDDPLGTYTIELEGRDLREYELVGRRFFNAEKSITLALPGVRRARSQTAEVFLDGSWEVAEVPPGAQLVPPHRGATTVDPANGQPQHLRYDPLQHPVLPLRRVDRRALTCLVWKQAIDVIANSRGEDLISVIAEVSSRKPIRVTFDDALEVVSLQRNGQTYPLDSRSDGELLIEPERQSDHIVLLLRRRHDSTAWLRRCAMPRVSIDGHVLQQRQAFQTGPGSLLLWSRHVDPRSGLAGDPAAEETVVELFLLQRNWAIAVGWMIAAAVFSFSWAIAGALSRGIHLLFVVLVVSVSASIIWWPWQLPILGWLTAPIALGVMIHLLLSKDAVKVGDTRIESQSDDTRSLRHARDRSADFSATGLGSVFLCLSLVIGAGTPLSAQEAAEGQTNNPLRGPLRGAVPPRASTPSPIELLVPLDETYQPVGDKVYLSQSDYESILQAVDPSRPVDANFETADYRVTLNPPRDGSTVISAEIQADYLVRLARRTTRVRLPVRAETLRRIEILQGEESQIARFSVDESGLVTVNIPSGNQVRLRLTFVPTLSVINASEQANQVYAEGAGNNEDGANGENRAAVATEMSSTLRSTIIRLAIPAIHAASVVVEAPREITVESLGEPLGQTRFRSVLGRYEADLGPAKELVITCRSTKSAGQQRPSLIRRAYRISAGVEYTIVECEIEPTQSIPEGDVIQLTILGRIPNGLTSNGWRMLTLDSNEGTERATPATANLSGGIFRFVKQSDVDTPIRLLWRLPSELNDPTSTSDSKVMPIPEVFSSGSSRGTPTLFAIESASSVRVTDRTTEMQSVSVDDFLSTWRGYPGKISRAFLARDSFPSFVLLREKSPEPYVSVSHALHVDQDKVELSMQAEILDLRSSMKRILVGVPPSFRVVSCSVNGVPVSSLRTIAEFPDKPSPHSVLALGDGRVDGKMTIQLVGERGPVGARPFKLPRFEMLTEDEVREDYRVTRDRSVSVTIVPAGNQAEAPGPDESASFIAMTTADLQAGRIPVTETGDSIQGALRVRRLSGGAAFPSEQTTALRYDNGRWTCDTLLRLPVARAPAFVDVQVPSRWTTGLTVSGGSTWVQQQSSDESVTVVRIALTGDSDNAAVRSVVITGSLDNRDQVRVSVPDIVVLGTGAREKTIAVPNQLTTESIQWQPQSVRRIDASDSWHTAFGSRIELPETYSLFATDGPNWSIELEPLSQATVDPLAVASDAHVMLAGTHVLVHQRFEILPETLEHISLQLPYEAGCLGVWVAEREIDLSQTPGFATGSDPAVDTEDSNVPIQIPLAYNRLPQALEVLFSVPVNGRKVSHYLARLNGIPTKNRWVAYYIDPVQRSGRQLRLDHITDPQEGRERTHQRLIALGQAVVTAIDRSRDMLAERSNEEIQQWLLPWIHRYRSLAIHDGHVPKLSPRDEPVVTGTDSNEDGGEDAAEVQDSVTSAWTEMDDRLRQSVGRFLRDEWAGSPPLFESSRLNQYEMLDVVNLKDEAQLPMLSQTFVPRRSLQKLLINWITLITFGLAVILLWPFRGRFQSWIHQPALWLFLVGAVGLFLLPPPVAIAMMILAVSLPLVRRPQRLL